MFEIKYGKVGPSVREGYDVKANYFVICAMFKDARKEANNTHEQMAEEIGAKKAS